MKKTLIMGVLILLLIGAAACASAEIRGYEKGRGYDYVTLGSYPYEADGTEKPVLWRVLAADDGQALLLTEYIIDAKQVIFESNAKVIENHSFRRISAYDESDLYVCENCGTKYTKIHLQKKMRATGGIIETFNGNAEKERLLSSAARLMKTGKEL